VAVNSEGYLDLETVEINVVWHCNISCVSCSHGSPNMPQISCDPAEVYEGLSQLARWMRTDHVRLVGGEPLLHPEVAAIAAAAHRSQITERTRIVTNGLKLADMSSEFWDSVSEVHVSVYPNTKNFLDRQRTEFIRLAEESDTVLVFNAYDFFRKAFRPVDDSATADQLTNAVYRTCQIAQRWRCITLDNGYLYRCPQAALPLPSLSSVIEQDRLRVSEITAASDIADWITSPTPLAACRGCAGSVGQLHPHRQENRARPSDPTGELDLAYLAQLCENPNARYGCVVDRERLA
jgi:organic radical activating enzyme